MTDPIKVVKPMHGCALAIAAACCLALAAGCAQMRPAKTALNPTDKALLEQAKHSSVFGPPESFAASPLEEVGRSGLFPVRTPAECQGAVLAGGEDSFAVRLAVLKRAKKSIRIQALIFKGDESGLRVAEILKQKKAAGLDVRVIVDAFSNPWIQTQWMLFDLKQNGIEVEGYEALALQWINEIPIPFLRPHGGSADVNKRHHEKVWIIDGETPQGIAVTGGLNIGNEYFRAQPDNPDFTWRDQDVAVRGAVLADMVAMFDRNFEHFVEIKRSRGIFNTNLYWDNTRKVLAETGKVPVSYKTDPKVVANVTAMEARKPRLDFQPSACRFLQSRPSLKETYIQQAYLKLIESAQRELVIANAYLVATPSIAAALKDAAQRCVAVTLVTNSPETNDLPEISLVGRGYYKSLLAVNDAPPVSECPKPGAGIQIWEWVGQAADEPVRKQGTMHSKFAIVDRKVSLVGSYNLDPRSEKLNSETALVFENPSLAKTLAETVLKKDLRFSRRITPAMAAEFEDPNDTIYRLRESIGYMFQDQL